jgi:hypothetical protein
MLGIRQLRIAIVLLFVVAAPVHADDYVWDQVNDAYDPPLDQNVLIFSPVGQEFLPNLPMLHVVQVWLTDYIDRGSVPATFIVNIHAGTINGPIVGTSTALTLPGTFNDVATFIFEPVSLVPQSLYVMEVVQLTSTNWGIRSLGGGGATYPLGHQILAGVPREDNDLWFREGIMSPVRGETVTWGQVKSRFL